MNIEGTWYAVALDRLGDTGRYALSIDGRVVEVLAEEEQQGFRLQVGGRAYEVGTVRGRGRRDEESDRFIDGVWTMRSPITGIVTEVRTAVGATIARDDVLFVVEAMKMLNELRARVPGVASAVPVSEGQRVELGDVLVEVREAESASGDA